MLYRKLFKFIAAVVLLAMLPTIVFAADPKSGETLFKQNCASCHNKSMKADLTGPALGGVQDRWESQDLLYAWIRNSSQVIADGDPYANALYSKWDGSVMTAFPSLTDAQLEDLLLYIDNMYKTDCFDGTGEACASIVLPGAAETAGGGEGGSNTFLLVLLGFLLLFSIVLLSKYINNLQRIETAVDPVTAVRQKSIRHLLFNGTVVKLLIFVIVLLGGAYTVNNAIGLGRQQGYAPNQPIKFSHELHAGQNGIDCKYCHDGARRSKHAVIPGMNTCMNCHVAVKEGPKHGSAEILKIYMSTGYDPTSKSYQYFDASVTKEERIKVLTKWLKGQITTQNEGMSEGQIEELTQEQMAAAIPHMGEAIKWVRIHNLPDHVYFNHQQHVVVGKVECQDCHGQVQEQEVLSQYAPLSMGWCINCHRQRKVDFDGNGYYKDNNYKAFEKYHNEMQEKKRKGVTVEDIGGLECQKCHY
jgi:cytochrome c2